jgi:hypothetical protein
MVPYVSSFPQTALTGETHIAAVEFLIEEQTLPSEVLLELRYSFRCL